MNIYIPMEIKAREFEGRGLLALVAAERGHTVVFGGKEDTQDLARRGSLPCGIVHLKSIEPSPYTIGLLSDLSQNGHLISVQDEENGLLDESYSRFAEARFSEETVSKASRVFAWGDHDAESLRNEYEHCCDRIISTGSPRVDFWRKEFDSYYGKNASPADARLEPYILVVSNFGMPLNENRFWNVIAHARASGSYERDPQSEYLTYDRVAYLYRLLGQFVLMVRALATSFPSVTILVRPHPIESVDGWAKLIGDYGNTVVAREGTISGWIRRATLIIHNGCTSGLEAAVCGVPRIAYRPIPSQYENVVPNRVSSEAFSLDQLQEMVGCILSGDKVPGSEAVDSVAKEILEHRFANLNGELAADRMVKQWEAVAASGETEQISVNRLLSNAGQRSIRARVARARRSVLSRRSKPQKPGFLTAHKFPGLEESEMIELHDKLQRSLDRFHAVRIKRFGRRAFVLFSK